MIDALSFIIQETSYNLNGYVWKSGKIIVIAIATYNDSFPLIVRINSGNSLLGGINVIRYKTSFIYLGLYLGL